jgi:predicted transcriptional regulator YdeE
MKPKIVRKGKMLVVGMKYVGRNQKNEISTLWDKFMPRMAEIKHAKGSEEAYGLCYELGKGRMEYVAGIPVKSLEGLPKGMTVKEVPPQTYAVFKAVGLSDIPCTYRRITEEWLPASGYEYGPGPDFEYYDAKFRPDNPKAAVYIYFPIRKKK